MLTPETLSLPPTTMPSDAPLAEPVVLPRPGRSWTAADLLKLADSEFHFELVRGDLLMMSPASPVQGRYAARLAAALLIYVEEQDMGEVYVAEPGFRLQSSPDETVRVPDVAFVRKERIPSADQQAGFWDLAPDLVVEIISPSETAADIQAKVADYLAAGTRLVWLVYPRTQTIVAYQQGGQIRQYSAGESLDGAEAVPGFTYEVERLFRAS
jgi:Uma2 family endonuclease